MVRVLTKFHTLRKNSYNQHKGSNLRYLNDSCRKEGKGMCAIKSGQTY